MKGWQRFVLIGLLLVFMVAGFSTMASAAPSLKWVTDSVYYDSQGKLVVDGYFINDGTRIITGINYINVQVYFRNANTNWWLQTKSTFRNFDVYLRPGDTSRWTLRISNVNFTLYQYWYVDWQADYVYL